MAGAHHAGARMTKGTGVTCPDCGQLVQKRGLASHRGSTPCEVNARREAMLAKGWQQVSDLRSLRGIVPSERVATAYDRGGPGKRSKVREQNWVPSWVPVVLVFADSLPRDVSIYIAQRLMRSEMLVDALEAAERVGGLTAARQLLWSIAQEMPRQ